VDFASRPLQPRAYNATKQAKVAKTLECTLAESINRC